MEPLKPHFERGAPASRGRRTRGAGIQWLASGNGAKGEERFVYKKGTRGRGA
jgi:hypothetical protein